jgi:hypothetical protein
MDKSQMIETSPHMYGALKIALGVVAILVTPLMPLWYCIISFLLAGIGMYSGVNNIKTKYVLADDVLHVYVGSSLKHSLRLIRNRFIVLESPKSVLGSVFGYCTITIISDGGVTTMMENIDNHAQILEVIKSKTSM